MPLTTLSRRVLSDLVVHEFDPAVGYARQDLNVTPDGEITVGTVVVRAKSASNTAATAWAVLDGASDVAATNEFAIVYGDHFGFNEAFTPRTIASGRFNAVGFTGKNGGLILKDWLVKQVAQDEEGAALTDAQFAALCELLKAQGIILETTLGV